MSQHPHRTLWCRDFGAVPAAERRLARLALQWLDSFPAARAALRADDTLEAMWRLTLPLLAPDAVAGWLPPPSDEQSPDDDADVRYESEMVRQLSKHIEIDRRGDDDQALDHRHRHRVHVFFKTLPRAVLTRLAKADGRTPVSTTIAVLGEVLGLDETSLCVLDFLDQREQSEALRCVLRAGSRGSGRTNLERLAGVLGIKPSALREALAKRAPLCSLGLLDRQHRHESDLEDFLAPQSLLREVLDAAPRDSEALLALLIEPAPAGAWRLDAFPHLAAESARLSATLARAAATGAVGVNALFYGAPGTGKTELARALVEACGLRAYQVRSADEDADGLDRDGRLSAYLVAQRLLGRRGGAVLIFDEVEDVFDEGGGLLAWLGGERSTGRQKGWMNRILEENPVPAIWITNRTDGMDPAFLRRFLLPVAFTTPPRSVRRRMAERHLGDRALPPALLDELAADAALAPAQLGAARRLLDLHPQAPAEQTVRDGIGALRSLLHGTPGPRRRRTGTVFDVAYLNLAGDITPGAIARALAERGHGSLCFYGPPGTGKTAFAEVLAEALDRELVARQASDLVSPYVGETEQNLARLFRDCDPAHTVLLLDEVDSFLADRRAARHGWERTQVNELLQQMEGFPGIFIAATNLMSGIDPAALRRFDFKMHFRALKPAQRLALFAREALGDAGAPVPPEIARYLTALETLTPGDFATVCRQRELLGETPTPEQFLRRLIAECRLKGEEMVRAA
ncbi:AAA family ATPase [Thiocapsa rosea]|uniref:SpoVK/Ycf46/Vps4 family AAA+-type ATPase n=1 Tax=Thiocapsa rosea TaxID=69360 RepID=A0A495V3J0_9GAMM|nr:AAA family ATPase [Thiocapsa rosea]RKT43971.1 SpoVK/Ycf46/Vps4 family AAA+-type ATPase [Thiocapsa rosea]